MAVAVTRRPALDQLFDARLILRLWWVVAVRPEQWIGVLFLGQSLENAVNTVLKGCPVHGELHFGESNTAKAQVTPHHVKIMNTMLGPQRIGFFMIDLEGHLE